MSYKYIKYLFFGYLGIIFFGTLLLMLPISYHVKMPFMDAFFTAASATCVTGLIVTSTSENFTFFGEAVILGLIQIGGIGYMTIVTIFFLFIKNSMNLEEKNMMRQSLDLPTLNVATFAKKIFMLVMVIELVAALILTYFFSKDYPFSEALWHGVFHSISAFNNAGFSLFTDSIMSYQHHYPILFTLSVLIILGGIGYFVLIELHENKTFSKRLSIHSRIMLYGTFILIIMGVALFCSIEWNNPKTLGGLAWYDKLVNAYFLSVNFRTSGFNSIDISGLKDSSLFFSTLFMMIGAGQGSTAGGIKITTAAVMLIAVWYVLKDSNQEPNIFKRTIDQKLIFKAMAIIISSSMLVLLMTFILVETQNLPFIKILFEVVSAFGTVGVSTGNGDILSFSEQFNDFGKFMIIVCMIAGRVGIFAFGVILVGKSKIKHYSYPKGRVLL